ncbi:MAG: glucose 1-dehydrogenase [Candidatus Tectomicrobia bacterium]|nr:glucose 1-dehydrogenase [Candidatus Tectomicrobia bacterium]
MAEQRRRRLEEKVAIVTGAGSSGPGTGTGKATSILFAREGAKVVLVDQDGSRAEETLNAIQEEGGVATVCEADVTSALDCRKLAELAVERYGRLDILFNNVGILGAGSAVDVAEDDWDRVLNVNLKGMMLTSKYVIPKMIESGGGAIVNISSIAGLRAGSMGGNLPYSVSKGGVIALTTNMAVEHGRDNIRVNCIAPGHIYTPMVAATMDEEKRELRRRAAPLGVEGTAWDIGWAALFLASDEARWISGVVLPVDAGLLATTPLAMLPHLQ